MNRRTVFSLLLINIYLIFFLLVIIVTVLAPSNPSSNPEDYDGAKGFNETVNWKPPPNTRGTFSIMSSCVLTWALCMWSAIHLNIPSGSWAKWQWAEKFLWLIWGMFCPDVIGYQALEQNILASELTQSGRNIVSVQTGQASPPHTLGHPSQISKRGWRSWFHFGRSKCADTEMNKLSALSSTDGAEWTLTHGFYTLMGGFALDANLCEEQFLPDGVVRVGLTAEGIKFLAIHAPEIIPNLPRLSEIKDKSKASSASKVIACMQVLWFCLQCFERSLCKLPVTLFEIATMAHCVYAIIMHFLWWEKPFSVEEPTTRVISGEKMSAVLSYLWMSSAVSYVSRGDGGCFSEFESLHFCPDMVDREASQEAVSFCHHSYNPANSGASLLGSGPHLRHGQPAINTVSSSNTSENNTQRRSPSPDSDLEGRDAYVTPKLIVSNSISSWELSPDDPTICKCCGILCSTSQGQHKNAQRRNDPPRNTIRVKLFPGDYLSIAGFCLRPESLRFKGIDYSEFPVVEPIDLEKKIYLNRHDINRWSLASLAITKYGLPVPSAKDCNYVELEISSFSSKPIPSEYQKSFLWKIAIINWLESMAYIVTWNYFSSADDNSSTSSIFLRGSIVVSFTPLVLILSSFGISSLSQVIFRRSIPFESLYVLNRYPFSGERGGSSHVMSASAWLYPTICVTVYFASKGVLVLVAVGDLFYLPDEAYQATTWSNYFPHIF